MRRSRPCGRINPALFGPRREHGGGTSEAASVREVTFRPAMANSTPTDDLQRSFDYGRTWSAVTVEGASRFTAGSAPLDGVCWLVDREAGIWRSIGGGAFERVSFSANAPLVAIEALDASRASVITSDGRQFTTIDGGTTWRSNP